MRLPGLKGEWMKPDSVSANEAGVPTYTWTIKTKGGRRRGECTNCLLRRDIGWAPGQGCYCKDPPRDERGRFKRAEQARKAVERL